MNSTDVSFIAVREQYTYFLMSIDQPGEVTSNTLKYSYRSEQNERPFFSNVGNHFLNVTLGYKKKIFLKV